MGIELTQRYALLFTPISNYFRELNSRQLKYGQSAFLLNSEGPRKEGPLGSSCRLTSISLPFDPETTTNTQLHEGSSPAVGTIRYAQAEI